MDDIELDAEGFLLALGALTREYKIMIGACDDEPALYPLPDDEAGPEYGYTIRFERWIDGSGTYTGLEWVKK